MKTYLALGVLAAGLIAQLGFAATIDFKNTANGVWSTGLNPSNVSLLPSGGGTLSAQVDPHYLLSHLPAGCTGVTCLEDLGNGFGPSAYLVLGPNGTYPLDGTWALGNDANSSWIGPRADQRNPVTGGATYDNTSVFASNADFYTYRLVFNLSMLGVVPGTAQIDLSWLSDSDSNSDGSLESHIRMCGLLSQGDLTPCGAATIVASGNNGFGSTTMTNVSITSGFVAGWMALDFNVYNPPVGADEDNPAGLRVEIVSATADDTPVSTPVPEPATLALCASGLLGLIVAGRRRKRTE